MAKAKSNIEAVLPDETISSKIYFIRGQKVMLDSDLALMHRVEQEDEGSCKEKY